MAVVAAGWSENFSALLGYLVTSASAAIISGPAALWNPPGICSLLFLPLLPLDAVRKPHGALETSV